MGNLILDLPTVLDSRRLETAFKVVMVVGVSTVMLAFEEVANGLGESSRLRFEGFVFGWAA